MSTRLKTIFNALAVAFAGWATRNSAAVPLSDWQFIAPAVLSAFSLGTANGLWGIVRAFVSADGQAAVLSLVSRLVPYRSALMPQELRDAVFNSLRYRFAASPEAIAHVEALVLLDMQLGEETAKKPV